MILITFQSFWLQSWSLFVGLLFVCTVYKTLKSCDLMLIQDDDIKTNNGGQQCNIYIRMNQAVCDCSSTAVCGENFHNNWATKGKLKCFALLH